MYYGKGHSVIGATLAWLRAVVQTGLRQLGLADVAPEPFTARQQRQSRMDGGEEEDGSQRDAVALGPPVEQPHIEQERARAAGQNRMPALGPAAFQKLPLTGAFQSTFPIFRQRSSFGRLGGCSSACLPSWAAGHRSPTKERRAFHDG